MLTLAEQISAANAKLDTILAPAEVVKQLTVADALVQISAELAKESVTKERATYLRSVLDEIAKSNFESTTTIPLKVLDDPTQIKPVTESVGGTIQTLGAATPDSGFASNMTGIAKAQLLKKLLSDKVELTKSKLTDKMDQIQSMFSLTDKDMEESYDISWKIGDLIRLLQNSIKLENMVGAGSTTKSGEEPVAKSATPQPAVWPADMASAKFDPIKKQYEEPALAWGSDSPKS